MSSLLAGEVGMRRLLLLLAMLAAPAQARPVIATVYDPWFDGRVAYCGGTYRHWQVSAAHPSLSCGTRVRVTYQGRSLVVQITDRCDCNSIDLSAGAAYRLRVPLDGVAKVGISY